MSENLVIQLIIKGKRLESLFQVRDTSQKLNKLKDAPLARYRFASVAASKVSFRDTIIF